MPLNALVVGPHRSGTTFVAKAIAYDRGHVFVPEEDIHYSRIELIMAYLDGIDGVVIQCPWAAPFIHMIPLPFEAIWVNRSREEIFASRGRMKNEDGTSFDWHRNSMNQKLRRAYCAERDGRNVAIIQREHWDVTKDRFARATEVNYPDDFKDHPLYIPPADRKHFHFRQTA